MDIASLNIGIMHSIVGKNDGVSIVIDQTVKSMVEHMKIPLGNIYFLAAHAPARFNTVLDESLWHKNEANKYIIRHFSGEPPAGFEEYILKKAARAEKVIERFIERRKIDLLIAHNTSHPYNFVGAVALGQYLEKRRADGIIVPRCLVWWHDSHYERERFHNPNPIVKKLLKYLPGTCTDGIAFINSSQPPMARAYLDELGKPDLDAFFKRKTAIIPNTFDVEWDWENSEHDDHLPLHSPVDQYNRTFLADAGIVQLLKERGRNLNACEFLLQHTRIVPRKRIDTAIDFAFRIAQRFQRDAKERTIVLLISGHSGDEEGPYVESLRQHHMQLQKQHPDLDVVLVFGEHIIFPEREVIVDRKFYRFGDIPAVIAARGGIGTYFSEVEGFGNNLLEMLGAGLPVAINTFDVYNRDIEQYGFKLAVTSDCQVHDALVEESYRLLTDIPYRNDCVRHNLGILKEKLNHGVMAALLEPLVENLYTYM